MHWGRLDLLGGPEGDDGIFCTRTSGSSLRCVREREGDCGRIYVRDDLHLDLLGAADSDDRTDYLASEFGRRYNDHVHYNAAEKPCLSAMCQGESQYT